MSRVKLFIPLMVFIVIGVFLAIGLKNDPNHLPSALIGKPFPTIDLPRLRGGELVTREELIGEPFILNVWATWCPTCIQEHPYLMTLAEQSVRIVGLNYKDENAKALNWLERLGDPYILNIEDADGRLGLHLGVYGAPETFLVDSTGTILLRHAGDLNERVWHDQFVPILSNL